MSAEKGVLNHFEGVSSAFDGVYAGRQSSFLYAMVDALFRKAILEKRKRLMVRCCAGMAGKSILDIGCGPGLYALELAKAGSSHITGIDISPAMIELARGKARASGLERHCDFKLADFMSDDFSGAYDIAVAAGVFDYVKDAEPFLRKIGQLCKKGAAISFPIKWTLLTPLRISWLFTKKCPNYYYTKKQIRRLFRHCGLEIINIYRIGSFVVPGNYVVVCRGGK
jgi:2-polyprenyl-3-methyl-5-hydroxy-6-metoxy-1,4-benzoquinol methylase